MSRDLDEKYHRLALTALHERFLKQGVPEESVCSKNELLEAFDYSGNILRGNRTEEQVRMLADGVFETCIRLARCIFFPKEARVIVLQGKEYTLEEHSQAETLRRNMDDLKRIAKG